MRILFSILGIIFSLTLFAQQDQKQRCNHDALTEKLEQINPGYRQQIVKSFKDFNKNKKSSQRINITIPIHVIVVHPSGQAIGTGSNFSLEHVQSQIDVLNQDFGRYNSDAGNTPPEFPAADTGIQFCLATVDPNGNPTDGITRYPFDGSFVDNAFQIRQETRWPRESYANIWTAPNLPYLGVASVPTTSSLPHPDFDLIHIDAATFGGPGYGTQPGYDLGRTATHEMGHWLGLLHVWGPEPGGCGLDDNISDTPLQNTDNAFCPSHPSPSCGNSGDMFMNYMDYVFDNCMNAFTLEQGSYMNTILSTSRSSLNGSSFTACAASVPLELIVISQNDPSCTENSDGFILVEAIGGVPDYSYSLDGGVPTANNLFSDLPGGIYSIEAFDSNGNSAEVIVTLTTPLPLTANVMTIESNICPNDTNATVQIQVAGGSNPYTYTLDMGMSQNSNTFSNLANGFYVVNIEDNNGCMLDVDFEISSATAISITIDSTANLVCSNDNMGLIIASAEGGSGPLSYSIDGINYQGTGEFVDLDGGDYIVNVQDSLGCYDSLEVNLSEPDPFFLSVQSTDATCYGYDDGFVSVLAMGGNGGPYQYSFDSLTYGDTTMLDSLFAGDYDLYALDSLGCLAIATFNIDEPDEVQLNVDQIYNVSCVDSGNGMMSLFATGGSGEYTYIFQGDSTATAEFSNLTAGMYEVFVVDMNGCERSDVFEIGVDNEVTISTESLTPPSCFGDFDGSILVSSMVTQGVAQYTINNGPLQESPLFDSLPAGTFQITAFDSTGCNASMTVMLGQPEALTIETEVINVSCKDANDGLLEIIMQGGTSPYTFAYSPDGPDPSGFAAGEYEVTATDANGCKISDEFSVTEPDELIVEEMVYSIDPEKITVLVSGGTEPYMYSFDGGLTFSDNNVTEDLGTGTITVLVIDGNGCEAEGITFVDGVNDLAVDWGVNAYPNPFQEDILLSLDFPQSISATIEVFDVQGRKVYKILAKKYNSGENFVKIDLSNFASSIYIVKIASAEGYRYIKVTKM